MKKIILFIILLTSLAFAQNSQTVYGKLVTIKTGNEIIISDYIDSARIESPFAIEVAGGLNEISVNDVEPLPGIGEECIKDKLYAYNGEVIICIQTHFRTIFPPEVTPNLFNFYREGTNLEWQVNELVAEGDVRIYNGVEYRCLMGHTCLMTWTPPATLGILWEEVITETCPDWVQPTGAHDAYQIGDCVTFNGNCYESLINANVWSPAVYPAGWNQIPCP